ncbi:MAG TPA: hypothetical protein VF995_01625 [Actinomycetota bacterium]
MTSEPTEHLQRAHLRRHLPPALLAAANDRVHGASEIATRAIEGLLEVAARGDPELLEAGAATLLAGQPAMAPVWHVAMAARQPDPVRALAALTRRLGEETEAAARTAAAWLREHAAGPVRTVSESSLVGLTLRRLAEVATEPGKRADEAPVGLVGADAIGPVELLNATGTAGLAAAMPTIVVATSIKLVPAAVFERLAAPGFERIPRERFAAVVLGAEVVDPAEAGRRAAAIRTLGE